MIVFQKLRWRNILSTGNAFTELNLTKSPNTLVIEKFVDGISEESIDNNKLKTVMRELYVEALNQEQA